MHKIYVPSGGAADWQKLLAEPEKHWSTGYSAKTLARCWEAAEGLPHEISAVLQSSQDFAGKVAELLVAFPEWKVALRGGPRPSQNDVFALVRCGEATLPVTIEGKVAEPFGPTMDEWFLDASNDKRDRLHYLQDVLGMQGKIPGTIRYQLVHRAASALIESERFKTDAAAMLVHSFSDQLQWFDDFSSFCGLFRVAPQAGKLARVDRPFGRPLYLGWVVGDKRFLSD
jgi:hypothetical protein